MPRTLKVMTGCGLCCGSLCRPTKARNEEIGAERVKMYDRLTAMRMGQKFDSFRPQTDEQKRAVQAYEELKKKAVSLPEFYFEDVSLSYMASWVNPRGETRIVS